MVSVEPSALARPTRADTRNVVRAMMMASPSTMQLRHEATSIDVRGRQTGNPEDAIVFILWLSVGLEPKDPRSARLQTEEPSKPFDTTTSLARWRQSTNAKMDRSHTSDSLLVGAPLSRIFCA
jgi:hypothetical protein